MNKAGNRLEVLESGSRNAFTNLALEEVLLLDSERHEPVLLFYRNNPALVIGRHQNPWMECDTHLLSSLGIPLARRLSGGGAVYHDRGNLNYALIMDRADYDRDRILEAIAASLAKLGLRSEVRNTSSLFANGLKVSGSAFCFKRGRVLHHGTMLIKSDLELLRRSLQPRFKGIDTHAVESVPARVGNLSDMMPDLTEADVAAAIAVAYAALLGRDFDYVDFAGLQHSCKVAEAAERLGRDDWVYGNTPAFDYSVRAGETGELRLHFVKGRLQDYKSSDIKSNQSEFALPCLGQTFDEIVKIDA